jgi:O-antigen biosynthesis protein
MSHSTQRKESSAPERAIAPTALAVLRFLTRWTAWLARNPLAWSSVLARTRVICRQGGFASLGRAVLYKSLGWQSAISATSWYDRYRRYAARHDHTRANWPADAPHLRVVVMLAMFDSPRIEAFLRSLTAQSYPYWDLLCLDDTVADVGSRRRALSFASFDARVRVVTTRQAVRILQAADQDLAERELYILLAERVAELEIAGLASLAETVTVGHADLVHGDHIQRGSNLETVAEVAALPAFSYELFLATGYFAGCAAVRATLLRELDGQTIHANLQGGDSFELLLHALERAQRVSHAPAIVACLRPGATRLTTRARAVERHLRRIGCSADVASDEENQVLDIRARLTTSVATPRVAIVVPTRNAHELLRQCVDSLQATGALERADLWIVDHATDETAASEYLDQLSQRHQVVRASGEFNFSRLVNQGVAAAGGGYSHYLLLNNDIEALSLGWLDHLLAVAMRPAVGAVGATLLYPDEVIQHAGVVVGMRALAGHYQAGTRFRDDRGHRQAGPQKMLVATREVSAVTAACLLVSREAWTVAEGFDESIAVGYGDVDFCLRLGSAGLRVLHDPHAVLVHHESRTRGRAIWDPHPADTHRFLSRYRTTIRAGDPFYSPLLSNVLTQCQLGRVRPGAPRTSIVTLPRPLCRASGMKDQAAPGEWFAAEAAA